jgi:hypothetical protein
MCYQALALITIKIRLADIPLFVNNIGINNYAGHLVKSRK